MSDRVLKPSSPAALPRGAVVLPIALACVAVLLFYARALSAPLLLDDDLQILAQSWSWQGTREGLWVPQNEHAMPLGRLFTHGLERIAGRPTALPLAAALVGPVALLAAMLLLYLFVRRELGHPLYGLLALVLFGVSSVYHQAVWWFAASFSVLALDTLLLGLLAAQRWRQTGRGFYLDLTFLACLLAPGWFASGVLAGPLCCLYLLPAGDDRRHWSVLPLVATLLFLAVSLPLTAATIMHLEHYGGRTAVEAFQPLIGLRSTARSVVDNLLLGVGGIWGIAVPVWLVPVVLLAAAGVAAWWWRQAPERRLMLLGLGTIGSSYWLVYSARALWDYAQHMTEPAWSRYHLLPHLGLVLFFCGGLPGRRRHWFHLNEDGTLTRPQWRAVCVLIGICFLVQLPRGLLCGAPGGRAQIEARRAQLAALRRIEEVDALCREYHISAAAARQALPPFYSPALYENRVNGWDFLRGSDDPHPRPPEEVKALLEGRLRLSVPSAKPQAAVAPRPHLSAGSTPQWISVGRMSRGWRPAAVSQARYSAAL